MANYELNSASNTGNFWFESTSWTVVSSNSTVITVENRDGTFTQLIGSFQFSGNTLVRGTVTVARQLDQTFSTEHERIDNISADVFDVRDAMLDGTLGFFLLSGNDTIQDNYGGTIRPSEGNDTITADPESLVHAGGGNDDIDFLSVLNGESWISYEFEGDGTRNETGYIIDLDSSNTFDLLINQAGIVRDRQTSGLQETDMLNGARNVRGSHGDDVIEGALVDEELDGSNIYSEVHGLDGDDIIRWSSLAFGGNGNDTFTPISTGGSYFGQAGDDRFAFVVGSDPLDVVTINGGSDQDTLFSTGISPVTFDLGGNLFLFSNVPVSTTYDVTSVENLETGLGADRLSGSGVANVIDSGGGEDTVEGLEGDDTLRGGADNDMLYGEIDPLGVYQPLLGTVTGNDSIFGDQGDDTLNGQLGDDTLDGGEGTDTALFSGSVDIDVSLKIAGAQATGHGNDTLISIENLTSGEGDDRLKGDTEANLLTSNGGKDKLFGGDGNDTMISGDGNDSLRGGFGDDVFNGGADQDTAIFHRAIDTTVDLNVAGAQATGHGNDTLIDIEDVRTAGGNDHITGDNEANFLKSRLGNDTLLGGVGDDTLKGGAGEDTLQGDAGNDRLLGGADADEFVFEDGFGNDTITDFDPLEIGEQINLRNVTAITSFTDLIANHVSPAGSNTIIDDGAGNTIRLTGVSISDLSADDFIF